MLASIINKLMPLIRGSRQASTAIIIHYAAHQREQAGVRHAARLRALRSLTAAYMLPRFLGAEQHEEVREEGAVDDVLAPA